jgi:hypothetical protein
MTTGLANINVKGAVAMVSFASVCLNSTLLHPGEEKLAGRTRIARAPPSSLISEAVDGIPPTIALAFTRQMTQIFASEFDFCTGS